MYKIGIIGYGAIGSALGRAILEHMIPNAHLVAVLVRDAGHYRNWIPEAIVCTDDAKVFFAQEMDIVIEAAGQDAVRTYALQTLSLGMDLLVCSLGAFTDATLFETVRSTAYKTGTRLYLVAGALPGVDWLHTASQGAVVKVTITQMKPVQSWLGTEAESLIELPSLSQPTTFFTGSARQAASMFQRSSNITAMLALATVGLDQTQVNLVADPSADAMETHIEFEGTLGALTLHWKGVPSLTNPSTSADVPYSVIKALKQITASVVYGI